MTDKQIIIDENKINPNDWLEPYKPIPACEIKDCDHLVYAGNDVYGCRIAEDGLVCDDFNNDDECCMYRQLEYCKEALKAKEQECQGLKEEIKKHNDDMFKNPPEKRFYCKGCTLPYISKKLKQTLAEIKEIVGIGLVDGLQPEEYSGFLKILQAQILQKISECEVEE